MKKISCFSCIYYIFFVPLQSEIKIVMEENKIIIYQTEDGQTQIDVRLENETVWLTQAQMVELFQTTKQNVSLHLNNLYKEGELKKEGTVKEYLTVQQEGKRNVSRKVKYYDLDVIISVGYRVKSKRGTAFRIWARNIIKDFLVKGYAVNEQIRKEQIADNPFVALTLMIAEPTHEQEQSRTCLSYAA